MSTSLTSGSYGRQHTLTRAIKSVVTELFDRVATSTISTPDNYMCTATTLRARIREAEHARRFAHGVNPRSSDSAADR